MDTLPVVRSTQDIDNHAVEQVQVIGQYTQLDIRQRPVSPALYNGHVAITLNDGVQVLLYPIWHVAAKRSIDEIARYENQWVIVVGTIFPRSPSAPDGSATLNMPCLIEVESIDFVP